MNRTRTTAHEDTQARQKEAHRRHLRREEEQTRSFSTVLKFWRDCASPRCRRSRACQGDASLCYETRFRALPQADKEHVRAAILGAMALQKARGRRGPQS